MNNLKIKKNVYIPWDAKDVDPFLIPDDSIHFYITIYFYEKIPRSKRIFPIYKEDFCKCKTILIFDSFKFDDSTKGENILTKIKMRINEELKKKILVILLFLLILLKSTSIM